jgi:hypothetical protein
VQCTAVVVIAANSEPLRAAATRSLTRELTGYCFLCCLSLDCIPCACVLLACRSLAPPPPFRPAVCFRAFRCSLRCAALPLQTIWRGGVARAITCARWSHGSFANTQTKRISIASNHSNESQSDRQGERTAQQQLDWDGAAARSV